MRTVEWRGVITAQSSIAHGGTDSGTTHGFRRETLLLPSGKRLAGVPVISGGVVRGDMRRLAARMVTQAIAGDGGKLPFNVVHALRTGGSLRETRGSEEVITGEKQAILRDLMPMLSVFGFSTRGRIISGRLFVDKPLPLARETMFLAPSYGKVATEVDESTLPSVWELVQRETYTRFGDANESVSGGMVDDSEGLPDLSKGSGNMIWAQETLCAGTRLFHSVRVEDATPIEVSFTNELMTRWTKTARLGAQRSRGMGRFSFDHERVCTDILGDEADDEPEFSWREYTKEHLEDIQQVFSWL